MTGMSAVDLTASIGTRYDWDRTSVRMVRTWERRVVVLGGCIRFMREDFIGEV